MKKQSTLSEAALHMIRYHSFYPWHREGAYKRFECEADKVALTNVLGEFLCLRPSMLSGSDRHLAFLAFNPYDLYSKSDEKPDPVTLRPYYETLIAKFFPEKIDW